MSRESKIFVAKINAQQEIAEYESFGWELLSINGNQVSLTRETQNDVYSDLVKYQAEYESLNDKLMNISQNHLYKKASVKTACILLLLGIVPGVLYILYKNNQKQQINQVNAELEVERKELIEKINEVCNTSRAVFFSKKQKS